MLELAVRLNRATWAAGASTPVLPDDDRETTRIVAKLNEAAERFWSMRDWAWSRPIFRFTIGPGAEPLALDRTDYYRLPETFAGVVGKLQYVAVDKSESGRADQRAWQDIDRANALETQGAAPRAFSTRVLAGAGVAQRPQFAVLVWPKPDRRYVCELPIRVAFQRFAADALAARPQWPQHCDEAVLALAHTLYLQQWTDSAQNAQAIRADFDASLYPMCVQRDEELDTDNLGPTLGPSQAFMPAVNQLSALVRLPGGQIIDGVPTP